MERYFSQHFEFNEVYALGHGIILQTEKSISVDWEAEGEVAQYRIAPGQVTVLPAYLPFSSRTSDPGAFISVNLEPKFFTSAAAELGSMNGLELIPRHGVDDNLLQRLVGTLYDTLHESGPEVRFYAESVATLIAVHIAKNYSNRIKNIPVGRAKLTKQQLARVVDYIHAYLHEPITLEQLASVSGLSRYYFARQFKAATGLAPHEYLTRCRVESAKNHLQTTDASIAETAVKVGFCDQSHLTRHFKRILGVTPSYFQRRLAERTRGSIAAI